MQAAIIALRYQLTVLQRSQERKRLDIDELLGFLTKGGVKVITTGGKPVPLNDSQGKAWVVVVQDFHGYYVRLGIDALYNKMKASQVPIVSVSGAPYQNGQTRWLMVRDPDNIYVQPVERPPAPRPYSAAVAAAMTPAIRKPALIECRYSAQLSVSLARDFFNWLQLAIDRPTLETAMA